jgi:hypothetical protein
LAPFTRDEAFLLYGGINKKDARRRRVRDKNPIEIRARFTNWCHAYSVRLAAPIYRFVLTVTSFLVMSSTLLKIILQR